MEQFYKKLNRKNGGLTYCVAIVGKNGILGSCLPVGRGRGGIIENILSEILTNRYFRNSSDIV